jgi:hypothetical protein
VTILQDGFGVESTYKHHLFRVSGIAKRHREGIGLLCTFGLVAGWHTENGMEKSNRKSSNLTSGEHIWHKGYLWMRRSSLMRMGWEGSLWKVSTRRNLASRKLSCHCFSIELCIALSYLRGQNILLWCIAKGSGVSRKGLGAI